MVAGCLVHRTLKDGLFTREQIVCTKTLYSYADFGLLNIRNIDLPKSCGVLPKKTRVQENKRNLGRSIKAVGQYRCPVRIRTLKADLIIRSKSGSDDALLIMIECNLVSIG